MTKENQPSLASAELNRFLVFLEECFAGRIEPTSPAMQMIEDDRERVRQAMAEKAAQHFAANWETMTLQQMIDSVRSLAGAEPQSSSIPNKENE